MTNLKPFLCFCLFFFTALSHSQWTPTPGPEGGATGDVIKVNNTLLVISSYTIHSSTNNGESWTQSISGLPEDGGATSLTTDGNTIYVALVRNGIYKSTDEGNSWVPANKDIEDLTFYKVFANGTTIYGGTGTGVIYRSLDSGENWTVWSTGVTGYQVSDFVVFNSKVYVGTLDGVFENDGNSDIWTQVDIPGLTHGAWSLTTQNGILYVGGIGEVYVSNDNLSTWVAMNTGNASISDLISIQNTVYAVGGSRSYFYSNDDGATWSEVLVLSPDNYSILKSLLISNGKIIVSSTSGNYESLDNGMSWTWNNTGIRTQNITTFASNDYYLFTGTGGNGLFRSADNGVSWTAINSGIDRPNAFTIHEMIEVDNKLIIATSGGVFLSNDNGDTWEKKINPSVNIATSALDYSNGVLVSGMLGEGIYLSEDLGETWDVFVPEGLDSGESYVKIALEGSTMLLDSGNGDVYLSTDMGQSWNLITTLENDSIFIEDIDIINGKLFVSDSYGLHKSSDMGQTWTTYQNTDYSIVENITVEGDVLYLATRKGFKATTIDQDVWYSFTDGMGNLGTTSIFLNNGQLFAGTYRFSVWSRPVSEVVVPFPDDDNDGVANADDLCPNTYPGIAVNEDGCDFIAIDALSVVGKSQSCPNVDNARIVVGTTLSGYAFDISLEGEGISQSFENVSLEVDFILDNLPPGSYEVIVSIPEIRYEQLFGLTINEMNNISGKRTIVDKSNKVAKYLVSGSNEYVVNVNGHQKRYFFDTNDENEILIRNLQSSNMVRISGKNECQGTIEDNLVLETEMQVYPTITSGMLSISGETTINQINVYNSIGQLVLSKKMNSLNNKTIHLENQSAGFYVVHLVAEDKIKRFKIIKQ
ncbi:hypothetical protein Murru_3194 [Allomuricauda ruestringensis DSM 13258]|uniref:Secretion system C-terminal sorting domain-containing protein n=1 Tax=Allomuricauda ruestringensis (strain DSM 13258 / CIP 107369 / LMG 19739 / B1) TaxID=886377 RepID=G2PLU5_ALLRU|nr:T9SS type A sorting domain-containing protein [Allomuricauda ruestringensis]AEM72214.1 hypothetical protein Murru_3194 [Allomuricauda ruestringensis DSM 13258]